MICKVCGNEFNEDCFDMCPYCLTPNEQHMPSAPEVAKAESSCAEEETDILESENNECPSEDISVLQGSSDDYQITEADLIEEKDRTDTNISIDELGLSARAINAFRRAGISTLGELLDFLAKEDVSSLKNVGAKTVEEIGQFLDKISRGGLSHMTQNFQEPEHNIFEVISPDLDYLSVEALVELGLSIQCVMRLKKNGVRCCGELRPLSNKTLKEIVGYNNFDKLPMLAEKLQNDIIALFELVMNSNQDTREREVFIRRAKGETLQEIADAPGKIGSSQMTRERVRQLERSYERSIQPFVNELVYILKGSNPYLCVQDLVDIYDDDDFCLILVYACKQNDEFIYLDFADMLVEKKRTISSETYIFNLVSDFVGTGIDIAENMDALDAMLTENGLEFIGVDAIINLLRKHNYHRCGNFISKGKTNYSAICMDIVKHYFPNGIKLSQSEGNQSEDILKLREIVNEKYPGVVLPVSDRAISSTLVRSGLVLRGRGQYIPEENISIDDALLAKIKEFIDSRQADRVFYNEVFAEFEGVLNILCGVDNYNYLHGILALRFPDEYEYNKDYLLKNGKKNDQAESISDRLYSFICEKGRAVSKMELLQEFKGISEVMLLTPFISDSRLFQWECNTFSCTGLLNIAEGDIEKLENILTVIFEENMGYASDPMFYERVQNEMPDFIARNSVGSEMNLHYLASVFLQDKMDFRRPHIGKKGVVDVSSTKNVALHLLGYTESFSYDQYKDIVKKMSWSRVTAGMVSGELETYYYRVAVDKYIAKKSFVVPDTVASEVYQIIKGNMKNGILPMINLDMDEYPEWTYPWNEFLVESVAKACFDDIRIVQPSISDRRYQRGFLTLKDYNIMTYPQIVAITMKSFGYERMAESQFLSFLMIHNLARKVIPNELNNSEFVRKDGEYFCTVNG